MSHLANISVRVGRNADNQSMAAHASQSDVAKEAYDRFNKLLGHFDVDFKQTPWQLGPELTFDGTTEKFTSGENHEGANALIRRKDREPFLVPEIGVG